MSDHVLIDVNDGVAVITLNNEKTLNALSTDDFWALGSALEDIAEMDNVYLTMVTGKGRFFSAGANLATMRTSSGDKEEMRKYWMEHLASHNMRNARAFYTHPKVLVVALNGPVIGYTAALIAYADFIYAADKAYVSTPFVTLGLLAEGVASVGFTQRMGIAKANDALLRGKIISSAELLQCGFVNDILTPTPGQDFRDSALAKIRQDFGPRLDKVALLQIKALLRRPYLRGLDEQSVEEAYAGWQRFVKGLPQQHIKKFAKGRKPPSKL